MASSLTTYRGKYQLVFSFTGLHSIVVPFTSHSNIFFVWQNRIKSNCRPGAFFLKTQSALFQICIGLIFSWTVSARNNFVSNFIFVDLFCVQYKHAQPEFSSFFGRNWVFFLFLNHSEMIYSIEQFNSYLQVNCILVCILIY